MFTSAEVDFTFRHFYFKGDVERPNSLILHFFDENVLSKQVLICAQLQFKCRWQHPRCQWFKVWVLWLSDHTLYYGRYGKHNHWQLEFTFRLHRFIHLHFLSVESTGTRHVRSQLRLLTPTTIGNSKPLFHSPNISISMHLLGTNSDEFNRHSVGVGCSIRNGMARRGGYLTPVARVIQTLCSSEPCVFLQVPGVGFRIFSDFEWGTLSRIFRDRICSISDLKSVKHLLQIRSYLC